MRDAESGLKTRGAPMSCNGDIRRAECAKAGNGFAARRNMTRKAVITEAFSRVFRFACRPARLAGLVAKDNAKIAESVS